MAHETGLRTSGHFMLGLPGETGATMAATLDLALRLPLDIAQFYAGRALSRHASFTERPWKAGGCALPGVSARPGP